jgi:hypothetical protein
VLPFFDVWQQKRDKPKTEGYRDRTAGGFFFCSWMPLTRSHWRAM